MRNKKYLFITLFLSCMVICLSAPRLWAGGSCSETATTPTDTTHEEILSEFDPEALTDLEFEFRFGPLFEVDYTKMRLDIPPSLKGPAAGDLPDTFNSTKKPPMLNEDGKPSKYSDENGDWYWGTDGHLYPWPPPEGGTASQDLTVDEAWGRALEAEPEASEKAERLQEALDAVKMAKKMLQQAIDDAMNAKPGKEAIEAAERVKDARKVLKMNEKYADEAAKEFNEAYGKVSKAMDDFHKAREKAAKAEKANKETKTAPDPVDEALVIALTAGEEEIKKAEKMQKADDAAKWAAKELSRAMNDAMDAKPDSKEAQQAAERVKQAAKAANATEKEAQKAAKEFDEASKKTAKAMDALYKAREKAAREEAEKQNKAAGEAAKKAYEATGHSTSNKK